MGFSLVCLLRRSWIDAGSALGMAGLCCAVPCRVVLAPSRKRRICHVFAQRNLSAIHIRFEVESPSPSIDLWEFTIFPLCFERLHAIALRRCITVNRDSIDILLSLGDDIVTITSRFRLSPNR
jgi:hypothetical protein